MFLRFLPSRVSFVFALLAFTVRAIAAPGDLDTSFGTGGKVRTAVGNSTNIGQSVAVQSDGKIVVAGHSYNASGNPDFALARYTTSGALDATFGAGGKVTTPIGSNSDVGQSVALQSDGKIVVAGYSYNDSSNFDFALVRYTASGALDATFGTGGKVTTPIGSGSDVGQSVALQSDGKIVVAGYSDYDFALVRYTASGALDATFGTGGKMTTPIGSSTDYSRSVALQSDGMIVVAGSSYNGTVYALALIRYTATGALDPGFGSAGKVTTAIGSSSAEGNSVALQSDGKIVVAGYSYNASGNADFALARYTTSGALDATFGTGGKVTTPIASSTDYGQSVALQSDGKIVVAGYSYNASGNFDFALARYTASGALDATFGTGGKVTTSIGSDSDIGQSVALQSDGKIVVAGYSYNDSGDEDFALVRYLASSVDPTFNPDANSNVYGMAVQPNGKITLGGLLRVWVCEARRVGHHHLSPPCLWEGRGNLQIPSRRHEAR